MFLFAIYRAWVQQWSIAILDFVVFIGMTIIFIYVYKTDNFKKVSLIIILLALIGNIFSFYLNGIRQVSWIYPAMLFAYYLMPPKQGIYVNLIMLMFYIPKLVSSLALIDIITVISTILLTNIIAFVFASGLTNQAEKLKKLASVDYLTQTGNRRALNYHLQNLHKQLRNHDKTASLVLLDLDHFKKINDTYGHIKGDEILMNLSKLLMRLYQGFGQVYRYGGEEFMIVCPNVAIEKVCEKSENIRKEVKRQIFINEHCLTVSFGIAEYVKEEDVDEWVHRVDLALYQAKKEGRDCLIKV